MLLSLGLAVIFGMLNFAMITLALARELMVALWIYLTLGLVPNGAVLHPSF